MQFLSVALPLALAGGALANPLIARGDACLAAVTGKAALGDDGLRKEHCKSFLLTTVTPADVTVTTTVTGSASTTKAAWKRDVTVCPNEVPNYASACNTGAYSSACSAFGVSGEKTITIAAITNTKTVYVDYTATCAPTTATVTGTVVSGTTCPPKETETKTSTVFNGGATVTSTVYGGSGTLTGGSHTVTSTVTLGGANSTETVTQDAVTVTVTANTTSPTAPVCLTDDKALFFVNGFKTLLEYTSYNGTQGPPGRGYKSDVSTAILDPNFKDYSDSINWMAGFPLGSVTFGSKAAFDYGQGILQPELAVTTLNYWYSCNTVSWRWSAVTASQATVQGINVMELTADLSHIQTNYAEFDNAAWLYSFGLSCKVPTANTTTSRRSLHQF